MSWSPTPAKVFAPNQSTGHGDHGFLGELLLDLRPNGRLGHYHLRQPGRVPHDDERDQLEQSAAVNPAGDDDPSAVSRAQLAGHDAVPQGVHSPVAAVEGH
jgi:hypothetical protein